VTRRAAAVGGIWAALVLAPAASGTLPAHVPVRGPADAPVLVTVFADLRAPAASRAAIVIQALLEERPAGVRVAFRHHPARGVADAVDHAVRAAGAQDRFWEMLGLVLANQDRASLHDVSGMARQLGLDVPAFAAALAASAGADAIEADVADARRLRLPDGLAVFVGETPVALPLTLDGLRAAVAQPARRR
jgi:protein-disulfide isomerase